MKHKYYIGQKFGFLEVTAIENIVKRTKDWGKRNRLYLTCTCHKCGKKDYHILSYNIFKQKSCGCNRVWSAPPAGENSKLFKGYKEMSSKYLAKALKRSKIKKIEFDLDLEFLWNLFESQNRKCAISGLDINFGKGSKSMGATASLDRINSNLGYTKNNVQWVHKDINMIKNILSQEYFIELCSIVHLNNINR